MNLGISGPTRGRSPADGVTVCRSTRPRRPGKRGPSPKSAKTYGSVFGAMSTPLIGSLFLAVGFRTDGAGTPDRDRGCRRSCRTSTQIMIHGSQPHEPGRSARNCGLDLLPRTAHSGSLEMHQQQTKDCPRGWKVGCLDDDGEGQGEQVSRSPRGCFTRTAGSDGGGGGRPGGPADLG